MHILRAADRSATPWKNGGGVTREVAAWPPGAGFDDFHWRVSMAEVRADGPFSMFPGVDRILAVLQGRLALDIEGRATVELDPGAPPAAFPGDAPTAGRVLSGPVTDLNVMTRRGRVQATLSGISVRPGLVLQARPGMRMLIARAPLCAEGLDLATDDALLFDRPGAVALEAAEGAHAYLATFQALF